MDIFKQNKSIYITNLYIYAIWWHERMNQTLVFLNTQALKEELFQWNTFLALGWIMRQMKYLGNYFILCCLLYAMKLQHNWLVSQQMYVEIQSEVEHECTTHLCIKYMCSQMSLFYIRGWETFILSRAPWISVTQVVGHEKDYTQ